MTMYVCWYNGIIFKALISCPRKFVRSSPRLYHLVTSSPLSFLAALSACLMAKSTPTPMSSGGSPTAFEPRMVLASGSEAPVNVVRRSHGMSCEEGGLYS